MRAVKKTYKVENLCCAVCAQKIEDAVQRLDGVEHAALNFIMGKLTVVTAEGVDPAAVLPAVRKAAKKIERDCEIVG